jgi:deazaflavin-dependent oxidoreductase (nitroreductase family)
MTTTLADRLVQVANTSTLRLTHYGRRSGTPYGVTIWFLVEGEAVCLATANRKRQWPRNVAVRPEVKLQVGNERFTGRVEVIADRATIEHVTDLLAAKYWYTPRRISRISIRRSAFRSSLRIVGASHSAGTLSHRARSSVATRTWRERPCLDAFPALRYRDRHSPPERTIRVGLS